MNIFMPFLFSSSSSKRHIVDPHYTLPSIFLTQVTAGEKIEVVL